MSSKSWRKAGEYYRLEGSTCRECSALHFPGREVCSCGGREMIPHIFAGEGSIVTFTVIRTPVEQNIDIPARAAPYVMAVIALSEGPRLTAEVVDCQPEDVAIGKLVLLVFRKLYERKEGVIQYGYKFRLKTN